MSSEFTIMLSLYTTKRLTEEDIPQIQGFLNLFDDFFLLCEGEKGTAIGLLSACPDGKDITVDKILMGVYSKDVLIGIIDLIKDYPEYGVWTVGYLLIRPDYRNQKIGSKIIKAMYRTKGIKKLRCVVQPQNPGALKFWGSLGFITAGRIKQRLEHIESELFILEKEVVNEQLELMTMSAKN